jgi:hypothetical protein
MNKMEEKEIRDRREGKLFGCECLWGINETHMMGFL